jgi:hypothetical protein
MLCYAMLCCAMPDRIGQPHAAGTLGASLSRDCIGQHSTATCATLRAQRPDCEAASAF